MPVGFNVERPAAAPGMRAREAGKAVDEVAEKRIEHVDFSAFGSSREPR